MKRPRATRLAALLRRLADRIDPPARVPSEPVPDVLFGPPEYGPLTVVRERQEERLHELEHLINRIRDHDPDSGLLWFESWQLEVLKRYLEHELRLRGRRFELVAERWR